MTYSFDSLSPADFEDVVRDLIGSELSCRFEAFGPGPDGGVDGRHATSDKTIILQAKHYRDSSFATLKSRMRKERIAIDRIAPDRYILATSLSLTPSNKSTLASIIGSSLNSTGDIFGFDDLDGLLRKHKEVAKAHIKLWLANTTVLEHIIHAASRNFTNMTQADIRMKLKIYVQNPSIIDARRILKSEHILIVSGAPGVGKTTLAEMLCYDYMSMSEEWELVVIRSLDDGFARISDSCKQVFFYDDFLGRIQFDKKSLSATDSDFARFLSRVSRTPNARLILTTRAYIYEQARLVSESLSDERLDVTRYTLDVGVYTRRIRARILYNHLVATSVPFGHIQTLVASGAIKEIIDHKHFIPRIVEWMTDAGRIRHVSAERYGDEFLKALNDPKKIWDKPFREQIPRPCQHLLIALYFAYEFGEDIDQLKEIFDGIHPLLCSAYRLSSGVNDFEESLKTLEGSFVVIVNREVSFINPSVRDYLKIYLLNKKLLTIMASGAVNANCAKRLVDQFRCIEQLDVTDLQAFLRNFIDLSKRLNSLPVKRPDVSSSVPRLTNLDMGSGQRIGLLLEWWRDCSEPIFLETATEIAQRPIHAFNLRYDAELLVDLLTSLLTASGDERNQTRTLVHSIKSAISGMFDDDIGIDQLISLVETINTHDSILGPLFNVKVETSTHRLIENLDSNLEQVDSVAELEDCAYQINKLAARVSCNPSSVNAAQEAIQRRIDEIDDHDEEDEGRWEKDDPHDIDDEFTDQEIDSLFAQIVADDETNSGST